jgi:pimeloyl-ACP methyl ester carboxylesterase
MPKIVVNGIKLHYWQLGKGPDLVMLHGLGGNLALWHLKMVPELQREYRVTTLDLRGHGYSDFTEDGYTTQELAEDLRCLLDALGIEKTHLLGHSWGGDIALHFALLYPDRVMKIIAIEAGLIAPLVDWYQCDDWEGWRFWAEIIEQASGVQLSPEKRHDFEYLMRQIVKVPIAYGPAKGRPRNEELVLRTLKVLSPTWNGENSDKNLTLEQLNDIRLPTLILYDTGSPYIKSYEVLCDRLVNATPVLLPNTGIKHFSPLEQPELILKHIREFITGRI